jgi:hypothetical protein
MSQSPHCAARSFDRIARSYHIHIALVETTDGSHGVAAWAPRAPVWLRRPLERAFARQARRTLRSLIAVARRNRTGVGVARFTRASR